MSLFKRRKGMADLAALEGRHFGVDGLMTALSFVLLFIIVVIPIFMIIYNAFFFEGKFDLSLFTSVIWDKDGQHCHNCHCRDYIRDYYGLVLCVAAWTQRHSGQGLHARIVHNPLHVPAVLWGDGMGFIIVRPRRICKPLADADVSFKASAV